MADNEIVLIEFVGITVMKFVGISNVFLLEGVVILLFIGFSYLASGEINKLDMTILMKK